MVHIDASENGERVRKTMVDIDAVGTGNKKHYGSNWSAQIELLLKENPDSLSYVPDQPESSADQGWQKSVRNDEGLQQ